MSANPYESPVQKDTPPNASQPRNLLGAFGFAASLAGMWVSFSAFDVIWGYLWVLFSDFEVMWGYFGITVLIGVCISSACIVAGFVLSLIGVWRQPRRAAAWGIAIGGFGLLYVPTMLMSLTRFLR